MSDDLDEPQWFWASHNGREELAGDRFVIARGRPALWPRVIAEIAPDRRVDWEPLGSKNGRVSLGDCLVMFFTARECRGVHLNRLVTELAQIPAFATFLHQQDEHLFEFVSNPMNDIPLERVSLDNDVVERLARRISATLDLEHA